MAENVSFDKVSPEIIEKVNQLMISGFELPPEKLIPSAALVADLGLDSLDAVDMLVYIEETMGIKVEGEQLTSIKTLGDVYVLAAASMNRVSDRASRPTDETQASQQL